MANLPDIDRGTTTANTVLFTLPAGYRPATQMLLGAKSANAAAGLRIMTNGEVQYRFGNNTYLSFAGISFATF